MSSTYVIPNLERTKNKPIEEWDEGEDYIKVGYTSIFAFNIDTILPYLSDNTPIVCIDNASEITNLKELKEYYKKFKT